MIDAAVRELEQSVIGAVILRPDTLALLPSLDLDHFATPIARAAWGAIRNCDAASLPIDTSTLGDEMLRAALSTADTDRPGFDHDRLAVSCLAFLGECALKVPTTTNAIDYARRLKDHWLRRRLLMTFAELIDDAKSGEYTGDELLSRALGGLSIFDAEEPEKSIAIGDIVKRRLEQIDDLRKERALGQRVLMGFPTGVSRLDDLIGGWQPGIVSLIAARPAHGKSALGLATADACTSAGMGVHVFSLEDTEAAYADRALSRTSKVPAEKIRMCDLNAYDHVNMKIALPDLIARKSWLFDDRSGISAREIVRSVRRHKKANSTRVAIVDYVQLIEKPSPKQTTHEALSEIMTTFATAAKQDQIAYVVMSQLNRGTEHRTDPRPTLADLRESGSLEERAKCVVGIYRGAASGEKPRAGIDYPKNMPEPNKEEFERLVQLHVLKNSNGQTRMVRASWHGPTTRIE